MFGFLRLDLVCVSVSIAIVSLLIPLFFLTGFLNVLISASSEFVLCVGGHSHRKSFVSSGSVFSRG